MRIKATQLIKVEDFPDQKGWIGKLVSPINDFINQTIRIINDGIIYPDNFVGSDHVFKFTYQSESLTFPQIFQWPKLEKPLALVVVSATENGVAFIPGVAWEFAADGTVQLTSVVRLTNAPAVAQLQVGYKYQIRARVTP